MDRPGLALSTMLASLLVALLIVGSARSQVGWEEGRIGPSRYGVCSLLRDELGIYGELGDYGRSARYFGSVGCVEYGAEPGEGDLSADQEQVADDADFWDEHALHLALRENTQQAAGDSNTASGAQIPFKSGHDAVYDRAVYANPAAVAADSVNDDSDCQYAGRAYDDGRSGCETPVNGSCHNDSLCNDFAQESDEDVASGGLNDESNESAEYGDYAYGYEDDYGYGDYEYGDYEYGDYEYGSYGYDEEYDYATEQTDEAATLADGSAESALEGYEPYPHSTGQYGPSADNGEDAEYEFSNASAASDDDSNDAGESFAADNEYDYQYDYDPCDYDGYAYEEYGYDEYAEYGDDEYGYDAEYDYEAYDDEARGAASDCEFEGDEDYRCGIVAAGEASLGMVDYSATPLLAGNRAAVQLMQDSLYLVGSAWVAVSPEYWGALLAGGAELAVERYVAALSSTQPIAASSQTWALDASWGDCGLSADDCFRHGECGGQLVQAYEPPIGTGVTPAEEQALEADSIDQAQRRELLLSAARLLDRLGAALQSSSQQLTSLAGEEEGAVQVRSIDGFPLR